MRYDRPRTIRGRSTANYGNPYDNTPSIGKTIEDVPSGTNTTIMGNTKKNAELVNATVTETVNTVAATEATEVKTIVVGNVSYPASWVQPTKTFNITSIVENKTYLEEYNAMDNDTQKTHPSFKLGIRVLTTDEAKLVNYDRHNDGQITSGRMLWVSEFDIRNSIFSNPLLNERREEILQLKQFDLLVGCVVKVRQIVVPAGATFVYPFSVETNVAENNVIINLVESIAMCPYGRVDGTRQRDMIIDYATSHKLSADACLHMLNEHLVVDDTTRTLLIKDLNPKAEETAQLINTLKAMQEAGLDASIISSFLANNK